MRLVSCIHQVEGQIGMLAARGSGMDTRRSPRPTLRVWIHGYKRNIP